MIVRRSLSLVAALVATLAPAAHAAGKSRPPANFDVRYAAAGDLSRTLSRAASGPVRVPSRAALQSAAHGMQTALEALRQRAPEATMRLSPATVAPEMVLATHTMLSGPAPGVAGIDVVRKFLHDNAALYRLTPADIASLHLIGESASPSGLRMVRVDQRTADGLPVFQSETRFLLTRDGRVIRTLGTLVPSPDDAAVRATTLPVERATAGALATVGIAVDARSVTSQGGDGASQRLAVADARIAGPVHAQLGWFPLAAGILVPAYREIVFTRGDADWNLVVSAVSGDLLWRKNMRASASTQEARFSVYVQADGTTPAVSPAPNEPSTVTPGAGTQFPAISRTTVNMSTAQNTTFSPNGWIDDGGSTTTGNNVDAYLDTDDDDAPDTGLLDNNGRPVGNLDGASNNRDFVGTTPRDYDYTPAPLGGNPDAGDAPTTAQSQRGAVTNLFYITNWYHDRLASFGFDEQSGNFQTTNFSAMGVGGDPVLAETQDGSGTDNSNFSTPPDGDSGRMQMYIFDFPTPNRDGSLDASIVIHELTHGLSNRLIGDGDGLIWDEGGGMGEGWSDFYAMSLLHDSNAYDPNARYVSGAYATYQFLGLTDNYLYGIRRFPYSTDNSVNPLTWGDVDDTTYSAAGGITPSPLEPLLAGGGALEVHNIGEIWALTLWEVRARIIADPAGANGDVPTGNATTLQLVTDALKMTPINPSFTDARDALIAADCATNGCANEASIWGGFADRGLGYKAVAPLGQAGVLGAGDHMGVGESFLVPYLDVAGNTIDDSLGNNNGAIDPGEPIQLGVQLFNPWQNAAKGVANATATLATSTSGVTILTNSAAWGAIAAQGTTASTTPFLFTVSPAALCGQSIHFTLTVTSSLGTQAVDFTVRVGAAAGDGAPITYTRAIPGGLAIPDGDLQGVTDTFNVTDDLEINDLDFRIDSLTHTFTGDLGVELKAPNGYGTDMAYFRGLFIGDGDGNNFTNTLFDDDSANDLNLSASTDAPFTGDWLPAFNSPIWSLFGIPNLGPDPVGQLSRMNGLSTAGNWQVHVSDEASVDTGTLNSWSLIVTPKAFSCVAFVPAVAVTGTKTVSGAHDEGSTVTYTVTLTNNGSAVQADNTGHEFTDTLPAGLTLVSATATSGTPTTSGNTVDWDGSILLGGSVTLTITATINSGTGGTTISNQGTIAFDADANGSNEATGVTDDPGTAAANDPTSFVVTSAATITTHTKTVTGGTTVGGPITYTIVIGNSGPQAQLDNPGNEFDDTVPASVTVTSVSATSGSAANTANAVSWNGTIPAGGSVTITINGTVNTAGPISNQGTIHFDADGNGTNESSQVTDDPGTATADDATVVVAAAAAPVPTLSSWMAMLLGLLLAAAGSIVLRARG